MHSLHRFLVDYDMAMLRALAEKRGLALDTNRQTEAVDFLAAALVEPHSVHGALARLSVAARAALDRLQVAGGQMREGRFSREFGRIRPVGPGRLEREAPWQSPENPAEELLYLGLIFRAFGSGRDEAGPGQFVIIPDELRAQLPAPQAVRPVFDVKQAPGPQVEQQAATLDQDFFNYLVYVQNHDVRPYADGRLGRRDTDAMLKRVGPPGERRLSLLRHLAGRLGMVMHRGEYLRLEPAAVKGWLTASPGRQLALLQEAWRDDPTWLDLCHVPGLACDTTTDWLARYDAVAVRRAVLGFLARCPTGEWWSVDSLVAAVKQTAPDFQRPDGDYGSWYIRDTTVTPPRYLSGFESWDQVEARVLADLLAGPCCWLGVVLCAGEEAGHVCRLTEAGARFLALVGGEPPAPTAPPIVVQADFYIDVPAPAARYILFQLERFSDQEQADPCRYRLSGASLSRALGRGLRVDQIRAFLQRASGQPLPPNVARQLSLWVRRSTSR